MAPAPAALREDCTTSARLLGAGSDSRPSPTGRQAFTLVDHVEDHTPIAGGIAGRIKNP